MSNIINVKPNTQWNLLDYFIVQLSGENICNERISKDAFYNTLVDLVCSDSIECFKHKHILITKPFYPYILLSYYLLFHKERLDLANYLYRKISRVYKNNNMIFDQNEEFSYKILGEVINFLSILRELNQTEHRNVLRYHLELLTTKLNKIRCNENEWSCIFKDLIISHLEPNIENAYLKLRSIIERCNLRLAINPIDEELIEGYNLFITESFMPVYTFLYNIASKEKEKMEQLYEKIHKIQIKKESRDKLLEIVKSLGKTIHILAYDSEKTIKKITSYWPFIGSIVGGIILKIFKIPQPWESLILGLVVLTLPLSYFSIKGTLLVLKRSLDRMEQEINKILSSRLEKIARIIWSS